MNTKLKAIVVQPNMENMRAVCEFLKSHGYEISATTPSGSEAAALIVKYEPQVIISDAYLLDVDVCGMLDILEQRGFTGKSVFVVATGINSACIIENVLNRGVDLFTLIPFNSDYADRKIRDIYARKQQSAFAGRAGNAQLDEFELLNYVSRLMHEVGVPASIRSYDYIRESIMMALDDRNILKSITKELYPSIAKSNDTTSSRVERAIRHAVEVAWQRGDVEVLNNIFGYTVKSTKGKPTNGEFISMLTERVRLDLKIS